MEADEFRPLFPKLSPNCSKNFGSTNIILYRPLYYEPIKFLERIADCESNLDCHAKELFNKLIIQLEENPVNVISTRHILKVRWS